MSCATDSRKNTVFILNIQCNNFYIFCFRNTYKSFKWSDKGHPHGNITEANIRFMFDISSSLTPPPSPWCILNHAQVMELSLYCGIITSVRSYRLHSKIIEISLTAREMKHCILHNYIVPDGIMTLEKRAASPSLSATAAIIMHRRYRGQ